MHRSGARLLLLVALTGAAACPFGIGDDDPANDSPEALIGVWQYTIPGEVESTLEFKTDGTWFVVDADLGGQTCRTAGGSWAVNEPGTLTAQNRTENGRPVSEPVDETPYTLRDGVLTLSYPGEETETWYRADTMARCADYGWPTFTMTGEIDGVPFASNTNPPVLAIPEAIAGGSFLLSGWYDPAGPDAGCPSGCTVLDLALTNLEGPLVPGSYTVDYGNGAARFAVATLRPDYPVSDLQYVTDEGQLSAQPWTGSVTLTTVTDSEVEGTFDFVLYNGRALPPYPSVNVANGYFRLAYD